MRLRITIVYSLLKLLHNKEKLFTAIEDQSRLRSKKMSHIAQFGTAFWSSLSSSTTDYQLSWGCSRSTAPHAHTYWCSQSPEARKSNVSMTQIKQCWQKKASLWVCSLNKHVVVGAFEWVCTQILAQTKPGFCCVCLWFPFPKCRHCLPIQGARILFCRELVVSN